jgi:hypothetical protein
MPIYEYQGQRYEIADTDPDVAKSKILKHLASQEEPVPEYTPEPKTGFSSFIPAVKRGALGLQSLVGDVLPAMAGRVGEKLGVQGAGEYATRQMQEAKEAQDYIQQMYPSAVPSYKDIKGGGDFLTYVVESVGELIPSILPSIFTGGAAGIVGRGAVVAAKEAAEKTAVASAAKGLTEKEIKDLATQAGVDAAKKTALKYQAAGAIGGSAVQNVPEVYQNVAEETGKEDLGAALLFGGFNSVLDAITPIALLRKAKGIGLTEKELIGAWYKRAGKGAVSGFLTEGATEAVQEMSSAAAEKFVDNNKQFFTEKNFERFINAGLKGGIGGGTISGAANIPFGQKEAPAPITTAQPAPVTPAETVAPAIQPIISTEEALAKIRGTVKKDEVKEEVKEAKKVEGDEDVFDMPTTSEKIASLKADNDRIQNKLATGQYKNASAVAAANAKIVRQKAQIETLEAEIAKGGKNVTDRTDTTGGGVSAEILSGSEPSGTPPEAAASERARVADVGGATEQAAAGDAEQQSALEKAAVDQAAVDQAAVDQALAPKPFMGESAFTSGTERRFIEPRVTEEDLYPKAIATREEQKLKAAQPTDEEVVKTKQSVKNVKDAAADLIAGKTADKYNALTPEEKAMVDTAVAKYKVLLEFKEAKPMSKRKEKPPPGVTYTPAQYKKIVKAEAKTTTEKAPAPKKLSLIEERMAELRAIPSYGSANLEAIEGLRGGTTIGLMSNLMHGDLRGALQEIATDTSGQFTKLDKIVAKRLLESDTLPTLRVVTTSELGGKLGQYDAATDIAYISEDAMTSHVVLHETLHGFTLAIIKAHKDGVKFNQGVANLEKLYNHLKETYPELKDKYGMKNLAEFVSEAMSNPEFQEQLNALPYERGNIVINAFVEFVKDILNLLGIAPGKDFTALAYALVSTESILTEGRTLEATNPPPATAALAPVAAAKAQKQPLMPQLQGFTSAEDFMSSISGQPEPTSSKVRKAFTSVEGAKELIRLFQNERYPIKNWEDLLAMANELNYSGDETTAVYTQITLSVGRAEDEYLVKIHNPSNALYKAIGEYAKAKNLNEEDALKQLQGIFVALHEQERRHVKYLLSVPLNAKAAEQRQAILDLVRSNQINEETAAILKGELETLVANNKQEKGFGFNAEPSNFSLDENSDFYNVAGIRPDVREDVLAKYYAPDKELVDSIKSALQEIHKATIELNKKANYWSQPVSNIVAFYGFENYVPLKGRPDKKEKESRVDELLDFSSKSNGSELQEKEVGFDGRVSESENPLLQSLSDGVRAALRAGRGGTYTKPDGTTEQYGITLAIKNAIDKKLLDGKKLKTVKFADRYKVADDELLTRGENTFFHYNPDGSIDIYAISDPKIREAVRRSYRASQPLLDALNNTTSLMGQFHTRYNVAFAPMNFIRDTLTNAFTMGAEMGVGTVGAVASKVAQGGLTRALRVSLLYRNGKFKEIEALGEKDPYIKAMYEYIQQGGKVAYVSGIGAKSQIEQMQETLGKKGIATTKAQIDGVIDIWTNMFEFASRTAAYQVVKANYMNGPQKLSEREAQVKATAYVKNLANFEQVGQWGKSLGAIFMFFRPSATGAVRAIESLVPLFRNVDAALANLPEAVRNDPEAVAKFRENMAAQRRSAAVMLMSLAGSGAIIYLMASMLAEDDEDGRNKVAIDDMARWTRYARFHIPGTDIIFQMPWGFGLGAFASAGAQITAFGSGNNSLKETFNNIKDVGFDAFLPLPASRINMWENPAAWAMDSVTPSLFRPFFEYAMNLDGLGREIYNNRQTRSGDAYTGGDNIPELYKDAAKLLANITNGGVDWSPNTMYFFANNYADGLTRLVHNSYNIGLVGTGQKEFNPKTDTLAFDMFFGAKSNFDAREFSKMENMIKDKERKLNMFKNDPERYMDYISANPYDQGIVDLYNKGINGDLKKVRELANKYRAMPDLTPKERKELLDNVKEQQNLIKRHLISVFKAYEELD